MLLFSEISLEDEFPRELDILAIREFAYAEDKDIKEGDGYPLGLMKKYLTTPSTSASGEAQLERKIIIIYSKNFNKSDK